jgi:antitoxin HigA-1
MKFYETLKKYTSRENFIGRIFNSNGNRLSKDTGIPQTRISAIIKGKRAITADTALRLAKYFGVSAKFWLGLQDDFDIENESRHLKKTLNSIRQFKATAA